MENIDIVLYPDSILRRTLSAFEDVHKTPVPLSLADRMRSTLEKAQGAGLSANQIGVDFRMIAVLIDNEIKVFIDPVIVSSSDEMIESAESCLSLPGIDAVVNRHKSVKVSYSDEEGSVSVQEFDGWLSRVFQHEIDHMNGILFTDHLSTVSKVLINNRLRFLEKFAKKNKKKKPRMKITPKRKGKRRGKR